MFTWTNSAQFLICLSLTACASFDLIAPQGRAVPVHGGAVLVAAPPGYCANAQDSTDKAGSAVVLMGRCSANSSAAAALLTSSVGALGSGIALDAGPVALTSFFTSDQGRSMLAASGKAADAIVTASETEDGSVLLRIKDTVLGEYWRAIMAINGRLVMLSATGADSVALPPEQGRALLTKAMAALRRANPKTAPQLPAAPQNTAPQNTAAPITGAAAQNPSALRPKPRVPISG